MAGTEHEVAERDNRSPAAVDPRDEPSAEWGWHGEFPRGAVIAGWISAAIVLLMLVGNHTGKIEDIWLVGTALVMIFFLLRATARLRKR